jgi:hypothetical protein
VIFRQLNVFTFEKPITPKLPRQRSCSRHHGPPYYYLNVSSHSPSSGFSAATRQCKTIWEMLGEKGLRPHVVSWFATQGEQNLNGKMVSNMFPFIGRVSRGFDFLGVDFQPGAPLAPSAVSLARKTEKIARLYEHLSSVALAKEEGASPERIGRYHKHWQRWLQSPIGQLAPAGPTPPAAAPAAAPHGDSLSHHSAPPRVARTGGHQTKQKHENENEKTGGDGIATLYRGSTSDRRRVHGQRGNRADLLCQ